jgi:hypothetical protein
MIGLIAVEAFIVLMALVTTLLAWHRDGVPPWRRQFWT